MATMAAAQLPSAQPDITLVLDLDGVIQEASFSSVFPDQDLKDWIGRTWGDTVGDADTRKANRILEDARATGVSAFRQLNQRFPGGLELPIEYTAVRLEQRSLIAVGKSLQAVAELQSRLLAAQLAIERDYWRLREVETRCHLLFDSSNEAVVLVRAENYRIVEANPAAMRALGRIAQPGGGASEREFLSEIAPEERTSFEAMLHRVRDQGKAPGILLRLGSDARPWFVRASPLTSQEGLVFLLQLTPAGATRSDEEHRACVEALIERAPDGFVIVDRNGIVQRANRAFLDLVQVGHETSVLGERIGRWLGRPGADTSVLLASVARQGPVRLFSTTLQGELGVSTEVEIAAVGDTNVDPSYIGLLVRDIALRLPAAGDANPMRTALGAFSDRIGKTSLRLLVKEAVGVVERHYIESALELTGGNRTAAAQLLGLSRQSLYAKLNRYELEGDGSAIPPRDG